MMSNCGMMGYKRLLKQQKLTATLFTQQQRINEYQTTDSTLKEKQKPVMMRS